MEMGLAQWGLGSLYLLMLLGLLYPNTATRWSLVDKLMQVHLGLSVCIWLAVLAIGQDTLAGQHDLLQTSAMPLTLLVLVSYLGIVIQRYARRNLDGDPRQHYFLTWYLSTLLAVELTIASNHLVIFVLGWIAISLCLHKLLLFYPERPRANLAAHKKFLFARLSEALLIAASVLLYLQHDSVNITAILQHYQEQASLRATDQAIAVLIALAALVKSAQLPLHGWLIQVVEAPTPVSALLHAGIINLGGYLLLLFSPLLSAALPAQSLLLLVAGLSFLVATAVMMTRISIKVRLAWSTVAQMSLMLIECALGLYELALLHIVAHSCYKANAFLGSGEAVNQYLRGKLQEAALPRPLHWMIAATCVALLATTAFSVVGSPAVWSPWVLIGLTALTLLAYCLGSGFSNALAQGLLLAGGGLLTYGVTSFGSGLLLQPQRELGNVAGDLWASLLFLCVFLIFVFFQYGTRSERMERWFITLNAAFYLDEWATRLTLSLWPIKPLAHRTGEQQ